MATTETRDSGRIGPVGAWHLLQVALVVLVLWLAWRTVAGQWEAVRHSATTIRPRAGLLAVSTLVVLSAYALLIATWRWMLDGWGESLGFWSATRIWFVSSFGKYVPGKVWAISAMALMAGRAGVSPIAAAGSSIVVQLLNLAAGFLVVVAAGGEALRGTYASARPIAVAALALSVALLAAAPFLLPGVLSVIGRVTGRSIVRRTLPARTLWLATLTNVGSWILYGLAFRLFTYSVLPEPTGAMAGYVAVYTASYLLGYLAFFAPGGLGVRESALVTLMPQFGLASAADAVLLAALSRLWLTVLEIVPGLLFLVRDGLRARSTQTVDDGSS